VVEIKDTGLGMAPEVLKRLFTPFFTTKPIGAGTGLGLSICHRLVTSVGGEIIVRSAVGQGSTFRICLLAAQRAPQITTRHVTTASVATRPGRILVVDDDPAVASALARSLAKDHDVTIATRAVRRKTWMPLKPLVTCRSSSSRRRLTSHNDATRSAASWWNRSSRTAASRSCVAPALVVAAYRNHTGRCPNRSRSCAGDLPR